MCLLSSGPDISPVTLGPQERMLYFQVSALGNLNRHGVVHDFNFSTQQRHISVI